MASETHQHTFGSYLKAFRLEQNSSIETIAGQTNIAAHCLRAIEESAHDRLPPPAYVKGFIRSYAAVVGADANVALALYLSDLSQQATVKRQRLKQQAKRSTIRRVLTAAAIIATILLVVRTTANLLDPEPSPSSPVAGRGVAPQAAPSGTDATGDSWPADHPPKQLKLQIVAVKQTWLKVIVDGQNARSYELKPEDRLELEGTAHFNLMIGDATGLEILLNGRPVNIYGSSGQVVSLKIP